MSDVFIIYLFIIYFGYAESWCYAQGFFSCSKEGGVGYSLVMVLGLLMAAVAEHKLLGIQVSIAAAHRLQSTGSAVVIYRLSYPTACGVFPN